MHLRSATLLVSTLLLATPARADEAPPPSYFVCSDKKAGDACDGDDGPGTCVAETCSRLDYSQGTPPKSVTYDCLKCRKAAPPPSPPPAAPTPTPPPAKASGCRGADVGAAPLLLIALFAVRRRRRHGA
jgi:MYXO-CTERM domain-containing protein